MFILFFSFSFIIGRVFFLPALDQVEDGLVLLFGDVRLGGGVLDAGRRMIRVRHHVARGLRQSPNATGGARTGEHLAQRGGRLYRHTKRGALALAPALYRLDGRRASRRPLPTVAPCVLYFWRGTVAWLRRGVLITGGWMGMRSRGGGATRRFRDFGWCACLPLISKPDEFRFLELACTSH